MATAILTDEHGHHLTAAEVRGAQLTLNHFTGKYLKGEAPLIVDGKPGHHTHARILTVKYYLGYGQDRKATWTSDTVRRMRHPHSRKYSSAKMLATAASRRARQRARWHQQHVAARWTPGVGTFDGRPVCRCAIPILQWCRHPSDGGEAWHGGLVSGWRSPAYSDSLCRRMCGRPRCPGLCAGRASNHSGSTCLRFAVDVSDYERFRRVVARAPRSVGPRIHNALPRDRVHFSPSGN